MFKRLENIYENMSKDGRWCSHADIMQLWRGRKSAYEQLGDADHMDDMVSESKAIINLIKDMLIKAKKTSSEYAKLIEMIGKVADNKKIDSKHKLEIVNYAENSLKEVLCTLKKHPKEAGMKIRFVKESLKDIKAQKEQLETLKIMTT